jgi:hypothetical protein
MNQWNALMILWRIPAMAGVVCGVGGNILGTVPIAVLTIGAMLATALWYAILFGLIPFRSQ